MCGIAGIYGFEDKPLLKKMTNAVSHRGPDNLGYFFDKNISLGYRRLSIIDTKERKQPIIHNENETIWISFNGEIYNFRELRKELEEKNHSFYTCTDTEAIVHAYEEFGLDFVKKLRGMFAFALWDGEKKRLVLARDRLGIKPLYYYKTNSGLLFASEIKSLLQSGGVKRKIDFEKLREYLTVRFVPSPSTLFKGIKKVLPGAMLVCGKTGFFEKRYWSIESNVVCASEETLLAELEKLFAETVKMHLISDVPVGIFLSGGIDSSALLSFMKEAQRENSKEEIQSFSIGFEGDERNEFSFAKKASELFSTKHSEIIAKPNCLNELPKIIYSLDEPVVDAVAIPKFLLSEFAGKKLKVVLTGEGGDEVFGGYAHYKSLNTANYFSKKIPFLKKNFLLKAGIKTAPIFFLNKFFDYPYSIGKKGKKRLISFVDLLGDEKKMYFGFASLFDEKDLKDCLFDENNSIRHLFDLFERQKGSFLQKISGFEAKYWLSDYILLQQDKLTMAHSLEGRVPFLDHKLFEFGFSLPEQFKVRNSIDKYLLRKMLARRLPKEIWKRKKMPFTIPIEKWFEKEIKELVDYAFDESFFERKIVKKEFVEKLLKQHSDSKLINSRQLFALIALEFWLRTFFDKEKIAEPKKLALF